MVASLSRFRFDAVSIAFSFDERKAKKRKEKMIIVGEVLYSVASVMQSHSLVRGVSAMIKVEKTPHRRGWIIKIFLQVIVKSIH